MSYDPYGPSGGVPSLVGAFASPLREVLGRCFTKEGGTTRVGPRIYGAPTRVGGSDAGVAAGRLAATEMVGVVVMLLVAGLLEGIGRQLVRVDDLRALIGGAMLAGWLVYFYAGRRGSPLA